MKNMKLQFGAVILALMVCGFATNVNAAPVTGISDIASAVDTSSPVQKVQYYWGGGGHYYSRHGNWDYGYHCSYWYNGYGDDCYSRRRPYYGNTYRRDYYGDYDGYGYGYRRRTHYYDYDRSCD
jgi:hypothetical protein